VFFHGGGFVAGNLDTEDTPLRSVTNRCGCIIVSVAYRLAPEYPYPAAPDDAFAATTWVAEHALELGGDARRIAVGGDGAGGNLAAVVALMARDRSGPRLIYQVLIYPDVDAILRGSRYLSNDPVVTPEARVANLGAYVPLLGNSEDPYISPIYAKSLSDLPPALLITDQDDPAWDEGKTYANRLRHARVPVQVSQYPNIIHGFFLMAGALDAGKKCIDEVAAALTEAFKGTPISSPVLARPH
jgi:acetyl esterase